MGFAQVTTLASLISPSGESLPDSILVFGTDGNFYGITSYVDGGTAYVVTPEGQVSTLYTFCQLNQCGDGSDPTGIMQATDGNLYGTTFGGGVDPSHRGGTFYKLTLQGQHTILRSFSSSKEGFKQPASAPVEWKGNFYGTTSCCDWGSVYKITAAGKFTVLHRFTGFDGMQPAGALVMGKDGYFRGTAGGGKYLSGAIFKISPTGAFALLYSFCKVRSCPDGSDPETRLIQATNGAFYGSTPNGWGTIFKIKGTTFKTVHRFCQQTNCNDGKMPYGPLTQGSDGNLYGVTALGGSLGGGTIYRITMSGVFTTLYSFTLNAVTGWGPFGGLVEVTPGNFYGTTGGGGTFGYGTVFKFVAN